MARRIISSFWPNYQLRLNLKEGKEVKPMVKVGREMVERTGINLDQLPPGTPTVVLDVLSWGVILKKGD